MYHSETKKEMEDILTKAFSPIELNIIDDSPSHAGHAAAKQRPSAGHFTVIMKSSAFNGLNAVKRHRLVYEKLGHLMDEKIHALSLTLTAADE